MAALFSSALLLGAYVTPAADAVALPRRRRARSDSDLPAQAPFLPMAEPPASAPMSLMHGQLLDELNAWLHAPAAKTFDQLTPAEWCQVGLQIGSDVLQPSSGVQRRRHDARHHRRADSMPYPDTASEYHTPPTASLLAAPFGHLLHQHSVPEHPLLHRSASPEAGDDLRCEWFDCPQRGHVFADLPALAAHLVRHVPHRRSLYPCLWSACPRGPAHPFPKRHKLIAHLRSHTLERPFACEVCGRGFAREDSRDAHRRVHGEERVGPWGCACQGGRVWKTWRGVRRHQAGAGCAGVARLSDVQAAIAAARFADDDD